MMEVSHFLLCKLESYNSFFNPLLAFVTASAYLGREYLRLGKTLRAGLVFAQAETRLLESSKSNSSISLEAQVLFYTHYAEYLSVIGSQDRR